MPPREPRKVQFVPDFPRPSTMRHGGKVRAKAESFRHQNSRASLLKVAEQHDRLARHADFLSFA